jgi:serine/threonine protein kinase
MALDRTLSGPQRAYNEVCMSPANEPALDLAPAKWLPYERLIQRFEEAWQQGLRPELDDYLPADEVLFKPALVELVHTDLEYRMKAGEAVRVEAYWRRYPDLANDRAAALDLILSEYNLRRHCEAGVAWEEYFTRFPEYHTELLEAWTRPTPHTGDSVLLSARDPGRQECPPNLPVRDEASHASSTAVPADPSFGRSRLGKYELLEVVGRGAFSVVYRARDIELERIVAIKVPRSDSLASPEEADRFLREARSVALLQHPRIVSLHDFGQTDDSCYLVYEFVPGQTLAQRLAEGPPSFRQVAELIAQIAEALDYAHRQGVIHRDIKPSNILLSTCRDSSSRDSVCCYRMRAVAAARPDEVGRIANPSHMAGPNEPEYDAHLMDFGLAKRDTGTSKLTQEGEMLGTPAYMSPELARGEAFRVDGRSDIYSLGVVLYELLTGEVPFHGPPRLVLKRVLEDEPYPPRRLRETIPRDLENICLKALSKEPGRRYPTAADLAEDLHRFLQGRPVQARPIGIAGKVWRWARRKPLLAGLAAALVLVTGLGFAGVTWAWRQAVAERNLVERQRREAEETARKARQAMSEFADLSFSDQLQQTPSEAYVRIGFAEKALAYYEVFLQARKDDLALRVEVAKAALHLAQAYAINVHPNQYGQKAADVARKALQLWQELLHEHPDRAEFQRYEAGAYAALGRIQFCSGQQDEAFHSLERACTLYRLHGDPTDLEARYNLSMSYLHLGAIERARGQRAKALIWNQQALSLAKESARIAPTSVVVRTALAQAFSGVACAQDETDHSVEALRAYQDSVALWKRLAEEHPLVRDYQVCLANVSHCLGNVYSDLKKPAEAVGPYQQAIAIHDKLTREQPNHPGRLSDLCGSWNGLGEVLEELGRLEEAREAYEHALEHPRRIVVQQPTVAKHRQCLSERYTALARVQRALGRVAEAVATTQERVKLWPENPAELYRAACDLALAVPLIGKNKAELTPAEQAERREIAGQAINVLRQAVRHGFREVEQLKANTDLNALRSHTDFQELLAALHTD